MNLLSCLKVYISACAFRLSCVLFIFAIPFRHANAFEPAFQMLQARLIADGLDSLQLERIFADDRLQFVPSLIERNLVSREVPDHYSGFLTPDQIEDGRQFLLRWWPQLKAALEGTQVTPAIVVAILKVESDLGRQSGRHPIINTLATITLLKDSLQWVAKFDTSGGTELERLRRRATRRSEWAYGELLQYLQLCNRENWDPLEVKGSWAGAFGWAQFMPSSYLRFARDGDGDAKIDPYRLPDAAASIAAYLQAAGWRGSNASHRRAVMLYNPSTAYADCVIEYARRLAQKLGSKSQSRNSFESNPDR